MVHFESKTAKVGDFINVKIKEALVWCLKGDEIPAQFEKDCTVIEAAKQ